MTTLFHDSQNRRLATAKFPAHCPPGAPLALEPPGALLEPPGAPLEPPRPRSFLPVLVAFPSPSISRLLSAPFRFPSRRGGRGVAMAGDFRIRLYWTEQGVAARSAPTRKRPRARRGRMRGV